MKIFSEYSLFFCLLLASCTAIVAQDSEWTWLYKKHVISNDNLQLNKKGSLLFSQYSTPGFTQLVFSWNALRPKGHFSFLVRARDKKTKKWFPWHRMVDWGENIQQSYNSTTNYETNYHHVRLEIPNGKHADAFHIKVESCNGADLSNVKGIYVSLSDLTNFSHEKSLSPGKSISIPHVPYLSQMTLDHPEYNRLCSPTSTSMLVGSLTKQMIDPVMFANKAYDTGLDAYGSWPFNTAHAYEYCNGRASIYVRRIPSFKALYRYLERSVPVVVSVRGPLKGSASEYDNGHLLLVVGWDAQNNRVLCHDPAFENDNATIMSYDLDSFIRAWERSRRLAYVAEPISYS